MAQRPFISAEIIRGGEINKNVRGAGAEYRARMLLALEAAGLIVQNAARVSILNGPKTGALYNPRGKVQHQASAPGEAPASDTGRLVNSIVSRVDETALVANITAGTEYAPYLEFGTRKMAARPFLNPALTNNRSKIVQVMRAVLSAPAGGKTPK